MKQIKVDLSTNEMRLVIDALALLYLRYENNLKEVSSNEFNELGILIRRLSSYDYIPALWLEKRNS